MPTVDCSELHKTLTALALAHGADPEVHGIDDVVARMQKDIPEITRDVVVQSIFNATTSHARAVADLSKKLNELKREARSDVTLRKAVRAMEQHLESGTLPPSRPKPSAPPEPIAELRDTAKELRAALAKSEPALRKRFESQIDAMMKRVADNDFAPPMKREALPLSKDLAKLEYQRDRLRGQIRTTINDLKPKTVWGRIAEPLNAARAVMTSFDLSAVLRQGGFVAIGNPARAAKSLGPMFRAFASEQAAHKINADILDRPNAPLYAKAKLYLSNTVDVSLAQREEAFMSKLAGKIPLVKNSERAYVTFLNKLRADSFDAMSASLARNGQPTLEESKALANFINVATGRGNLGALESSATTLNTVFFAPRYVASRFQLLAGRPFKGGSFQTKQLIAKEYAKYLIGMGIIYAIGNAAGGELEGDPRSADFGKIRFGNTRLDPLSGLAQVTTFGSRLVTGQTKKASGEVVPLRGPDVPYGGQTTLDTMSRFLRSKLSPSLGSAIDLTTGEDVTGNAVTPASAAIRMVSPLSVQDISKAIEEQGVERGSALSLLGIFGMGLQTYEPREKKPKHARSPN